jgi:hypothetical protein
MKRRRPYNPFPGAPASRRSRLDDAIDRDTRAAALQARNREIQERQDAALAKAQEAVGKPAANDDQTEKKQNG